eukprot:3357062-Ditylum_brightwellii.AAC.1
MTVARTHPKYPIPRAVPPSVARYRALSVWIEGVVAPIQVVGGTEHLSVWSWHVASEMGIPYFGGGTG